MVSHIVTRLQAGRPKTRGSIPSESRDFSAPPSRSALEPTHPPIQWYRNSLPSVSAGAWSWLLTSVQYFRVLLNWRREYLTFTLYIGLPFDAFFARIAYGEHEVSCVLFHLRNCCTDFDEVFFYWGFVKRNGRICFWLEFVQVTPVLCGVHIYLYTFSQRDPHETVVGRSDVK